MTQRKECQARIISDLSTLIMNHLTVKAIEEHHPSPDPDKMDDRIKSNEQAASQLRAVRQNLEDLFAEPN